MHQQLLHKEIIVFKEIRDESMGSFGWKNRKEIYYNLKNLKNKQQ